MLSLFLLSCPLYDGYGNPHACCTPSLSIGDLISPGCPPWDCHIPPPIGKVTGISSLMMSPGFIHVPVGRIETKGGMYMCMTSNILLWSLSVPVVPSCCSWTDLEIRIFLQVWEVVEQEIGHPGKKMKKKNTAVCQRLHQMGLNKCWDSCLDLMWSLKNLHTTLCNERPGIVPLFSPYAEALYRILGHKWQGSHVPGQSLLHRHFGYCE